MKAKPLAEACSCESGLAYPACCGRFHAGALAPTPEALMRARYSAYVLRLTLYLLATWHTSTRPAADELDQLDIGDPRTKWLGLKVLRAQTTGGDTAVVEFVARYRVGGGSAVRLHEVSRFARENGAWYYLDGEHKDS
ncbi:MAG: YchJ family metal-binding protein [Pseudomonadota bacterium]|nr:YchJ family metal-binding protein [Pseudomonadota bacterium]